MPLITVGEATDEYFDYVIVGGGTAGLVVAARLSENPDVSVLVLDAGKPNLDDILITRPGHFGATFSKPDYDWDFKTIPQPYAGGREFSWNRGKSLGGSSALNFCCWTVPPKADIDDWERLGNPKWNWDTYEKYIQRVATFYPNENLLSKISADALKVWDKKWGQGPLKLIHPKKILDVEFNLQQTFVNMGIPWARAPNGGDPAGVYLVANTLDPETNGRSYAASAFFTPNAERKNLKVLAGALVHKLNTEAGKTGIKATSVDFSCGSDGTVYSVQVKKEVILCAGALKSPQILELSGIGRPDVLNKINVPVKIALEGVGENVQDHNFMGLTYVMKDPYPHDTFDALLNPDQFAQQVELYEKSEGIFLMGVSTMAYTGLATVSPRAEELIARQRQKIESEKGSYPPGRLDQYEIMLHRMSSGSPGFEIIGYPGFMTMPNPPAAGKKHFSILIATNYSFNRGTIHVKTDDPLEDPEYDPLYFEHEFDRQVLVDMVKYVRKVARTEPISEFFDSDPVEINPGPEVNTDAEIGDWVTKYIGTTFHVCGSLSMLPKEKRGVVDTNLKVYGTENVRVADLSVVPLHFAAHPVSSVYTIGEIAADIICGGF